GLAQGAARLATELPAGTRAGQRADVRRVLPRHRSARRAEPARGEWAEPASVPRSVGAAHRDRFRTQRPRLCHAAHPVAPAVVRLGPPPTAAAIFVPVGRHGLCWWRRACAVSAPRAATSSTGTSQTYDVSLGSPADTQTVSQRDQRTNAGRADNRYLRAVAY